MECAIGIKEYFLFVLSTNEWTIALARNTVLILLLFIFTRHLMVGGLFRTVKRMDKDFSRSILKKYSAHSGFGWFFVALACVLINALVFKGEWLIKYMAFELWIAGFVLLIFLAVFFHLHVFTAAVLTGIKQKIEIEKN